MERICRNNTDVKLKKVLKIWICLLFLLAGAEESFAQRSLLMLEQSLELELVPMERLGVLLELAEALQNKELNRAQEYAFESFRLAQSMGFPAGQAKAHYLLGNITLLRGEYLKATEHYYQALDFYRRFEDLQAEAKCFQALSLLFSAVQFSQQAIDYQNRALELYALTDDTLALANALGKRAMLALRQGDILQAAEFMQQAKSLQVKTPASGSELLGYFQGCLSNYSGQTSDALTQLQRALQRASANEHTVLQSLILLEMGKAYQQDEEFEKARDYYGHALEICLHLGLSPYCRVIYQHLSGLYRLEGKPDQAFGYLQKYRQHTASLLDREDLRRISEIHQAHEHQRNLTALGLFETEKQIREARTERQLVIYNILLISLLMVLVLVSAIYIISRKQVAVNLQLLEKNTEIYYQRQELIDKNNQLVVHKEEIHAQNNALEESNRYLSEYIHDLEKFTLVARETDNAIIVTDDKFNYEWVNGGFERLFGYGLDTLKQRGGNLKTSSSVSQIVQIIDECVATENSADYESTDFDIHGNTIYLHTTLTPVFDEKGRLRHLFIVESDISAVKNTEHELAALNQTLRKKVEEELEKSREKELLLMQQSRAAAMGEMISNIAHQWRQPLNALGVIAQNLEEAYEYGELDETYLKSRVGKTLQIIGNMSSTVDNFRNFFKPNKDKQEFEVNEMIHKAISFVEAGYTENHISLELELSDTPCLLGYANEFTQVMVNILNNCRDAIVDREITQPLVIIRSYDLPDSIRVEIEDNAGGIPKQLGAKIFDPYFTSRNNKEYQGLGLYMARSIIEKNMNGSIWFENTGRGVCFIISCQKF